MQNQRSSNLLRGVGYKITPPRIAILEALVASSLLVTADFIFKKLSKKGFDKVTVYRNLNSFEKSGLIRKVNLQKNSTHYELADDHHHHIVCTECGRIEDFKFCLIQPLSKKALAKSPYFNRIDQHSIELFSICKKCDKD